MRPHEGGDVLLWERNICAGKGIEGKPCERVVRERVGHDESVGRIWWLVGLLSHW